MWPTYLRFIRIRPFSPCVVVDLAMSEIHKEN